MTSFNFAKANPLNKKGRSIDFWAQFNVKCAWSAALKECLAEDRRWSCVND